MGFAIQKNCGCLKTYWMVLIDSYSLNGPIIEISGVSKILEVSVTCKMCRHGKIPGVVCPCAFRKPKNS